MRKHKELQRKWERLRRKLGRWPAVAVGLVAVAVLGLVLSRLLALAPVTVMDSNGSSYTVLTGSTTPEEILQLAGVSAGENDEVVYTQNASGQAQVWLRRAFPVVLQVDGQSYTREIVEGTAADLLEMCDIVLGADDYTEPALHESLQAGTTVQVCRVTYADEVRREAVAPDVVAAYEAQYHPDGGFMESYIGTYDVTWRSRLVNGETESVEIVQMAPVLAPRPLDSYELTEGVPCSRIESFEGVAIGPAGVPVTYASLWENAICTAYSSKGGKGASGLGLYCGTVAVNPNVIPYGTRLYITSADGKFIYGFAIATDTGTAMMEGYVDVDLYFETNAECLQFGKRPMNVYILD